MMQTGRAQSHGLGVWFKDEIKNVLLSLDAANLDIAQNVPTHEMALYRKGYEAAIQAMALAFGISLIPAAIGKGGIHEVQVPPRCPPSLSSG